MFSRFGACQKIDFSLQQNWFLYNSKHFHRIKIDTIWILLYFIKLDKNKAQARTFIPRYSKTVDLTKLAHGRTHSLCNVHLNVLFDFNCIVLKIKETVTRKTKSRNICELPHYRCKMLSPQKSIFATWSFFMKKMRWNN